MGILLWLAAPLALAVLAMLWATWAGRPRRRRSDDEAQERLRAALAKPLPAKARGVVAQTLDRPTGVAVRPSQRLAMVPSTGDDKTPALGGNDGSGP